MDDNVAKVLRSELMNTLELMVETVHKLQEPEQDADPEQVRAEVLALNEKYTKWLIQLHRLGADSSFATNPDDLARNTAVAVATIGEAFERLGEVSHYINQQRAKFDEKGYNGN